MPCSPIVPILDPWFKEPSKAEMIYLIGALKNTAVPLLAAKLRSAGLECFDDWHAAGPDADDFWQAYEKARGHDFKTALAGFAAKHVFEYDRHHLDRASVGVLLLPAGKSGHLEAGYLIGQGKPLYIVLDDEPKRFDVMYNFAAGVVKTFDELVEVLCDRLVEGTAGCAGSVRPRAVESDRRRQQEAPSWEQAAVVP